MRVLNAARLQQNLEARIGADIASGRVGCAAVSVRQNRKTVYENCFGTAHPDGTPLSRDAIFRIASMTKPITAVAVLLLADAGKLSLDDRVDRYFPSFRDIRLVDAQGEELVLGKRAEEPITVWHLLTHTSGIGGGAIGARQLALMPSSARASLSEAVQYYAQAGLQFEAGSAVLYSGVPAFDVAAAIVEKAADIPFESFLKERIFLPCRMEDTTFAPNASQWERTVTMHDYRDGKVFVGRTVPGCVFEDFPTSHILGGAGLVSTLDDYVNFAEMLLCGGVFEGDRVLSEEAVQRMATPQLSYAIQPRLKRWGLAVKVITDERYGRLPIGAYGWSGAYGTHFWVDPANRITAVYMKNSQYDGGGDAVTANNFEEDVTAALSEADL